MLENVPRQMSPPTVKVAFDKPTPRSLSPLNNFKSEQAFLKTPNSSPFHYRPIPLNRYTSDSSKNIADELNDNISLQIQRRHYGRPITPDSVMLNTINAPKEPSRNTNIQTTMRGIRVVHGTRQTLYSCRNPVPINQLLNYSEYKKTQAAVVIQAYVRRFLVVKKYKKEEQIRLVFYLSYIYIYKFIYLFI